LQLAHYASRVDTLVLAVPCGGVAVAVEVAAYLNAPLDAFMVRSLTVPQAPDQVIGAIATGGVTVFDEPAIRETGLSTDEVAALAARELQSLERRQQLLRGRRPPPQIAGRVVILVDEGIVTGLKLHAAVIALHRQQPAWLVVAAPVGSSEACEELSHEVHEVICPVRPWPFEAVGLAYDHFMPCNDDEAHAALERSGGLPRA
jgi:putative phosphoribosyl transferase